VPHAIERPSVLYDQNGYPLRFILENKQGAAKKQSDSVDNKKSDIKSLLVTRDFFVIGDIQKPFAQIHRQLKIVYLLFFLASSMRLLASRRFFVFGERFDFVLL
jgi:hypothetical protein